MVENSLYSVISMGEWSNAEIPPEIKSHLIAVKLKIDTNNRNEENHMMLPKLQVK